MEGVWVFPLAAGAVLLLAALGWAFQAQHQAAASEQQVEAIRAMFPHIPVAIIRQELTHAGSVQVAIDRLLDLSATFPSQSPPTSKSVTSSSALKSAPVVVIPDRIDPETWKADSELRKAVFSERKRQMLLQARQSFKNKPE